MKPFQKLRGGRHPNDDPGSPLLEKGRIDAVIVGDLQLRRTAWAVSQNPVGQFIRGNRQRQKQGRDHGNEGHFFHIVFLSYREVVPPP